MSKLCRSCQVEKPLDSFGIRRSAKDGHEASCRPCINLKAKERRAADPEAHRKSSREYYQRNPRTKEQRKRSWLACLYGLSLEDYNKANDDQGGLCKICNEPDSRGLALAVDHCHNTELFRGLLCQSCNRGLGMFRDDVLRLKAAIQYLENFYGS